MAKSSTSFDKSKQPAKRKPRGKSERTKILEAMARQSKTEDEFYDELVIRAFNTDDNFTYKEVLARMSPIPKAVAPLYEFALKKGDSPHVQSADILYAVSKGRLPADIGASMISSITNMLKIKEVTDIEERLKLMEAKVESQE